MRGKRIIGLLLAGMLLCLAGCGQARAADIPAVQKTAEIAQPQKDGLAALSVKGTQLVDGEGNPVQLRGLSTHGLAWFPDYVNEECFRQLKEDWGANVIRLAMYTAESGGYCTGGDKERLKALIRKGVEDAEKCGLYAIIDWHILSDGNPNTYLKESEAFFDEMSKTYAGKTNVLYEICNEPNGGVAWRDVKAYAERIISVIRRNDPDGIILVGTPNWCQFVDQAAADPITGYGNIMYTLHFYAATHKGDLRNSMTAALEKGLPLFVSEFGICDASGNGAIDAAQAAEWLRLMDERKVSYVAWNISNKAETSAILQSGCKKTGGFAPEDYSESGKWLYQAFTGTPAPSGGGAAAPEGKSGTKDGLTVEARKVNSWEENGKKYSQYELTLVNTTPQAKNGWKVSLQFDGEVALANGWNGVFRVDGDTLSVSPVEYNKRIESGGTLTGIGFILCADGERSLR